MGMDQVPGRTIEESSREIIPKDSFYAHPEEGNCAGCGTRLELYEIFACRIRGLKKPVCLGCLVDAIVGLKDHIYPLLEELAKRYFDLVGQDRGKEVYIDLTTTPPKVYESEGPE